MPPVTFIMTGGVRPDALAAANCPNISALRAHGSVTMQASSVMPCITLPCHTSIFHSVPPARHGITDNTWRPMARPVPGLVDLIGPTSKSTAFFYNWEPLRDLSRPGNLDFSYFRNSAHKVDGDDPIIAEAVRFLSGHRPDLMFVYFGTVDVSGHAFGWMSREYLAQLERVDALLGRLLAALPADYVVLLQSDHGGHDRDHGLDTPDDMTIPWIVAGPGIRRSYEIRTPVSLLDTAPTIARLLGITPYAEWEGRCVEDIFE